MENHSALAPFRTPLFVSLAFCCLILPILWRLGIFEKNPLAAPQAGPQYVLVEGR
ncbi:MAG: hypothetical protein HY747_05290, partial [Elusimicrobia bacterium]|nr:hypothetical protein [Elusimicrobiota bacterium]